MKMLSPLVSRLSITASLAVALLAWLSVSSLARTSPTEGMVMAAPTVVGVVDLEKLMNGLEELSARNSELNVRKERLQGQLNDTKRQIEAIENDLKNNIAETDVKARTEKLAQKFELEATYEARGKAYQRLIDLENGDVILDLYSKARGSIEQFASRNGIDLVLLDDRSIGLPRRASVKEINSVIESKRVLYANNAIDITDRILSIMNNEFRAGINTGTVGNP